MVIKRLVIALCLSVVLSVIVVIPAFTDYAQSFTAKTPLTRGPLKQINEYFSTQSITYSDGTILERSKINGPPKPPPGHLRATVLLPEPIPEMGTNTLTVPAFRWVFGCSAVSASMIAGYYDRNGFPDMYTGPTGGGLIPVMEDPSWGSWTDSVAALYPNNPLVASHQGLDGRGALGSIDDYWVSYSSNTNDPYITGNWTQHTWGDAVGDYMKTSQSAYDNVDGSTLFYFYDSAIPLSCNEMEDFGIANDDGTYGRKLFYEARGYTVTDCYTQMTDNTHAGGFSFAQYKAQIDADRPVLLNLEGHSIVGVGYDDFSSTVYIHDTWDNSDHTMPWGGSYAGMALWGVSIVTLQESTPYTPDISVSPNSYDFGDVNIPNTSAQAFTISNTGTADLVIGTITLTGTNPSEFSIQSDNCSGQTLTSSASCTVDVVFEPHTIGSKGANLRIPSNDSDNPNLDLLLSGIGILSSYDQVTLLSPDGEEVIPSGSNYPIYWGAPETAEKFKLKYSLDDGLTWFPIPKTADFIRGTTYDWPVPKPWGNQKKCRVKVTGYKENGVWVGADRSDPFTIEVVKVTAPNGGDVLSADSTHTITWDTNGTRNPIKKVKLYYTKDGGSTWNSIFTFRDSNPGSYDWQVPCVKNDKASCKVKVMLLDEDGNVVGEDASNGYFTIARTCSDISGDWYGTDKLTVTCCYQGQCESGTFIDDASISIYQNDCNIKWTIPGTNMKRSGITWCNNL